MMHRGGQAAIGRDWFGLEIFRPGRRLAVRGTVLYLLEEVESTSDFLLGRGKPAEGRACHWDGWGWRADPLRTVVPPERPYPGLMVVARHQSAGRGRQGRSWVDTGGLFLSWTAPVRSAALESGLALWTSLQVCRVLADVHGLRSGLKWPNDLVCGERKLGGVIVDRIGRGREALVVVGLGLNTGGGSVDLPAQLQGKATSIFHETGQRPQPSRLAGRVLDRFFRDLDRFQRDGWSGFADQLRRADVLRGNRVVLQTPTGEVSGVARDIDHRGALVIEDGAGRLVGWTAGQAHVLDSEARSA